MDAIDLEIGMTIRYNNEEIEIVTYQIKHDENVVLINGDIELDFEDQIEVV